MKTFLHFSIKFQKGLFSQQKKIRDFFLIFSKSKLFSEKIFINEFFTLQVGNKQMDFLFNVRKSGKFSKGGWVFEKRNFQKPFSPWKNMECQSFPWIKKTRQIPLFSKELVKISRNLSRKVDTVSKTRKMSQWGERCQISPFLNISKKSRNLSLSTFYDYLQKLFMTNSAEN